MKLSQEILVMLALSNAIQMIGCESKQETNHDIQCIKFEPFQTYKARERETIEYIHAEFYSTRIASSKYCFTIKRIPKTVSNEKKRMERDGSKRNIL